MIIDFSNRLTLKKVEEMIESAVSFTTGVINLSTATADEVKEAFTDPDRWLCSVTYSGDTYLEQYRRYQTSGEDISIYFYVPGAEADNSGKRIFDGVYSAVVTPSTGEVHFINVGYRFVPDIIYDLDQMNTAQLAYLGLRLFRANTGYDAGRFGAKWTYNGKQYVYSVGEGEAIPQGKILMGMSVASGLSITFDAVYLASDGTVSHHEYTSNITLTPVIP